MRVLIAEDDPISRHVLAAALRQWDFQPVVVADGPAAWELLQQPAPPSLVVLDWNMPGMDGPEVCRLLRERKGSEYSYVILLTARGSKEDVVQGMEAGADDYIVKPFDVGELKVRLRAGRRILDLQMDLIHARESLRDRATHDDLTGLWNRRAILDVLSRELTRAGREELFVAVVMADIDSFKDVNDTHGHNVGDAVLQQVAGRMNTAMRPYDMVGRYGGEEFLVVVPGCGGTSAGYVGERIRRAVADQAIVVGDARMDVTISLGVCAEDDLGPGDADRLIRLADEALYQAKRAGRNCVRMAGAANLHSAAEAG